MVLGSLLASVAISVLALTTASGVTHLSGSSYDTEFVSGLRSLAWALPAPPAVIAWSRPRVAPWAGLAVVLPQLVTAEIVVRRYQVTGWADGLEVFTFAMPLALVVVTAGLVGLVAIARRRGGQS